MNSAIITVVILSLSALTCQAMPNPECMAGPGVEKNPMECCAMPKLVDEAIFQACKAEFPMPSRPPGPPPAGGPPAGGPPPMKGCCMSECIMNKTKVLVNGNFDKAAALTVLSKNADAAWKTVISTAVTTCETKATAKKAEFDAIKMASPAAAGEKVCGPISGYLLDCVYSEVFTNCPADKFTSNDECNKVKAFVAKPCPIMMAMGKYL